MSSSSEEKTDILYKNIFLQEFLNIVYWTLFTIYGILCKGSAKAYPHARCLLDNCVYKERYFLEQA